MKYTHQLPFLSTMKKQGQNQNKAQKQVIEIITKSRKTVLLRNVNT